MSNIDWNQKRNVFRNTETGEFYVQVGPWYMLAEDYVEGGRVEREAEVQPLERVGLFTNVQIQNGEYDS